MQDWLVQVSTFTWKKKLWFDERIFLLNFRVPPADLFECMDPWLFFTNPRLRNTGTSLSTWTPDYFLRTPDWEILILSKRYKTHTKAKPGTFSKLLAIKSPEKENAAAENLRTLIQSQGPGDSWIVGFSGWAIPTKERGSKTLYLFFQNIIHGREFVLFTRTSQSEPPNVSWRQRKNKMNSIPKWTFRNKFCYNIFPSFSKFIFNIFMFLMFEMFYLCKSHPSKITSITWSIFSSTA